MQGQSMTGSGGMNQMASGMAATLTEQDLFHNILVLLKHNVREYATAVTEANCAVVRQTMQRMLHETLAEQADCYQVMGRQGWYPPAPSASRQEVQKSIAKHRQSANQTAQSLQMAGIRPVIGHGFGNQANQMQQSWQQPTSTSQTGQNQWQNPSQQANQWHNNTSGAGQRWQNQNQNQTAAQYGQSQYQPVMQSGQYSSSMASGNTGATAGMIDSALTQSTVDQETWHGASRTARGEMTH